MLEASRGAIFIFNRVRKFNKEEYSWQYDLKFQKYTSSLLSQQLLKKPVDKVVVTGSENYWSNRVAVYNNVPVLTNGEVVNYSTALKSSEPVLLLVIIRDVQKEKFKSFLSEPTKQLLGRFDEKSIYSVYVQPK